MSTETDLPDQIERSFGEGPELPGVEQLLVRGRRALRRRRLAEAAGSMLVVAAVTVSGVALAGGGADRVVPAPVGPAATRSPTKAAHPVPAAAAAPRIVEDPTIDHAIAIQTDSDGLHVTPGLRITQRLRNPWQVPAPGWSIAVAYVLDGQRYWFASSWERGGGWAALTPAEREVSFRDWTAEQETIRGGDHGPAAGDHGADAWPGRVDLQLVRFVHDTEQLAPFDAVTLLQQRPHPDVPTGWAGPGDRSAVAEVRFEGTRYYVLARRVAGEAPQYIAVTAAKGGATLDDFLDLARQRYAEGGGGLL